MNKPVYFITVAFLIPLLFISPPLNAAEDADLLEKKGQRAKEVISKPTIVRVSELTRLPINARQGEFLVDRPHLAMVLARLCDPQLDLYRVRVRPDGLIHIDDPAGLSGDAEIIDAVSGRRIYYITGYFDVLKIRFNGRMVMKIVYSERAGETPATSDATTTCYVKVDNTIAGLLKKFMTFLFPKKVDDRINRFATAVRKVAVAVHDDPAAAYKKLTASGEVSQEELREFAGMFL